MRQTDPPDPFRRNRRGNTWQRRRSESQHPFVNAGKALGCYRTGRGRSLAFDHDIFYVYLLLNFMIVISLMFFVVQSVLIGMSPACPMLSPTIRVYSSWVTECREAGRSLILIKPEQDSPVLQASGFTGSFIARESEIDHGHFADGGLFGRPWAHRAIPLQQK